jgi:hypothetical protein
MYTFQNSRNHSHPSLLGVIPSDPVQVRQERYTGVGLQPAVSEGGEENLRRGRDMLLALHKLHSIRGERSLRKVISDASTCEFCERVINSLGCVSHYHNPDGNDFFDLPQSFFTLK